MIQLCKGMPSWSTGASIDRRSVRQSHSSHRNWQGWEGRHRCCGGHCAINQVMVDNMKHQLTHSSRGKVAGVLVWTAPNLNDLRLSKKLTCRMSMGTAVVISSCHMVDIGHSSRFFNLIFCFLVFFRWTNRILFRFINLNCCRSYLFSCFSNLVLG